MDSSIGLCNGCQFNGNCALTKQANSVFQCEEFETSDQIFTVPITESISPVKSFYTGLCGSCDHSPNCALKGPETVFFSCEHYQ